MSAGVSSMTRIFLRQHEEGFSDKCPENKRDDHHMIIPGFDNNVKIVCCALCNQSKKEEWNI